MIRRPPRSPLFPYTPLFRSLRHPAPVSTPVHAVCRPFPSPASLLPLSTWNRMRAQFHPSPQFQCVERRSSLALPFRCNPKHAPPASDSDTPAIVRPPRKSPCAATSGKKSSPSSTIFSHPIQTIDLSSTFGLSASYPPTLYPLALRTYW